MAVRTIPIKEISMRLLKFTVMSSFLYLFATSAKAAAPVVCTYLEAKQNAISAVISVEGQRMRRPIFNFEVQVTHSDFNVMEITLNHGNVTREFRVTVDQRTCRILRFEHR